MDCSIVQDQLVAYLLGSLNFGERDRIERHLDVCVGCTANLNEDGEFMTQLAFSVPQLEAPAAVKQGILARIDADASHESVADFARKGMLLVRIWGRPLVTYSGLAATILLVGFMVVAGLWFNNRLDEMAVEKVFLASELESVVRGEERMKQTVERQRYLLYRAADPGASVNLLSATEWSPDSSGIVITKAGQEPVLAVLDLPPLPEGDTYQVWLAKEGTLHNVGAFTVDATGYAQTNIRLSTSIRTFDAIVITVRREGTDAGTTEVLRGDL